MSLVQLDLRGLAPGTAPDAGALSALPGADAVVVRGPVPALAGTLAALLRAKRVGAVPVAWEPGDDAASTALARDLGTGSGAPRSLSLVRDERGGVLLWSGRIEPAPGPDGGVPRRLGLQAHHDDLRVADGFVRAIEVRPDWRAVDTIGVRVTAGRWRPARRSTGRALQVASNPARVVRDGVPYPRPVGTWTWYADHRVRWLLQP